MASVRRKEGSSYWICCFTDATGKQRQKSSKMTRKSDALRMAHDLESAYRRLKTAEQARSMISDAYREITGSELEHLSVRDFMQRWLASKASLSKRSLDKYKRCIEGFLVHLDTRADAGLELITTADIAAYRDGMAARLAVMSTNHNLKIVRSAFLEAQRQGLIQRNPAASVKTLARPASQETRRRPFTPAEVKRVLEACQEAGDVEMEGMVLIGVYVGARLGDICRLRWSNLDLLANEIRYVAHKTGRRMVLPLAKPLTEFFRDRLAAPDDPDAPLFPKAFARFGKTGMTANISNHFRTYLEDIGLVEKTPRNHSSRGIGRSNRRQTSELSFHSLRHSAVSWMKNAGIGDGIVMAAVGHASLKVSQGYTSVSSEALQDALAKMPDLSAKDES
ncbi:MAG: site-specific integrase [Verrucomicrobiota bacterium]